MDEICDGSPETWKERLYRKRKAKRMDRCKHIAVLDFETDPFDNVEQSAIYPFLCVVYSDQFAPIVIWNNDHRELIDQLLAALEALDESYTIYAHNGGRFDFMYLLHAVAGAVKFKGRALMHAPLGKHTLRDSLHIIPESLRNANRKTDIDYRLMSRRLRDRHRAEITRYCLEDCVATFEIVRAFVERYGMPDTIGQLAMRELKRHYKFDTMGEGCDRYFRQWFFGGRVECIGEHGYHAGPLKLFDVNSMYPSVMAEVKHPISGGDFHIHNKVTRTTAFIHLRCRNNNALVSRIEDTGELTTRQDIGEFYTTVHEYRAALELGLISDVQVIMTVDFPRWTTFENFVLPLYEKRQSMKAWLEHHPEDKRVRQDAQFIKYILNNAYGKFAQNPRDYKEYWITPPGKMPPRDWLMNEKALEAQAEREGLTREQVIEARTFPVEETSAYWIWGIPLLSWRFHNVATAASITGAARAKLMRAIRHAYRPLYCDTDSLICAGLAGVEISSSKLGAWNHEANISELILAGKKIYGYRTYDGKERIRAKGQQGVTWGDLQSIIRGATVRKTMLAPTITRAQEQHYMVRELRMTGV